MQVGFYNIGWTDTQLSGQNHEMHRKQLGRDCARAFEFNDLGMLCLCEVGNNKLDENLHAHLGNSAGFQDKYRGQDVNRWLEQVIQECCKTSIDLQAYVLGPYAIVLNTSICGFEAPPRLTGALGQYPRSRPHLSPCCTLADPGAAPWSRHRCVGAHSGVLQGTAVHVSRA